MSATTSPATAKGRNRRRWSRYAAGGGLAAELVVGERRTRCSIEDVSLAGARLRVESDIPLGAQARLDVGTSSAPLGRCVWREGERLGLQFRFSQESVDLALDCIRCHGGRPDSLNPSRE